MLPRTGMATPDELCIQALATRGEDAFGYRSEFVQLSGRYVALR